MQIDRVRVEVVSMLPSYCEVLQDAMGENSQNLSGELSSDDEYCGPMDLPCEMCSHFLFTEFKLARDHKAQLERILAEPGQQGLSERAKLHMKDCCLGFYAGLDDVVGGK